jgi:hypothetical protein
MLADQRNKTSPNWSKNVTKQSEIDFYDRILVSDLYKKSNKLRNLAFCVAGHNGFS